MISSIRLQDFKGHRDTTVPLGRLTALVGPNGSGKTSVLEALWLQSQLVEQPPAKVLSGDFAVDDMHRRGATDPCTFTSTGAQAGQAWSATMTLGGPQGYALGWNGDAAVPAPFDVPFKNMLGGRFGAAIQPATLYKLNAQAIAAAAYTERPSPLVERDGTNTSEALAALKLGYDEAFVRIEEEMRLIVPNVERVRIRHATATRPNPGSPAYKEEVKGSKIYLDFRGAPAVPAHAASEGTLITLALLTILHSPGRPGMILLDDFDQSLHPRAQMEFVRLIKRLLAEIDDLQIVAVTHSPYVLDELEPSEIHAFALRDDGTVATKRLSEHPEAERMKGALTTGQLWTLDPEPEWVIGARSP